MSLFDVVRDNFYFFVMLFTAAYGIAFFFFLTTRHQSSSTAGRFMLFLLGVVMWSVKDALGEALLPSLGDRPIVYMRVLAAISPMFLAMPVFAVNMLMTVYNVAARPERRFANIGAATVALGLMMAGVYVAALIDPHVLYRTFSVDSGAYTYTAGPGLFAFGFAVLAGGVVPALLLLWTSWGRWRTEAAFIAAGSMFVVAISLVSNMAPSLCGLEHIPRLGCLSMSVLCGLTFAGIVRYGRLFSLARVLDEHDKYRLIAEGMDALVSVIEENASYQKIADRAREISDSAVAAVVFFLEASRTYEARVASVRNAAAGLVLESALPFVPGTIYDVAGVAGVKQQLSSAAPLEFADLAAYLGRKPLAAGQPGRIKQVCSYAITHEGAVCGALVLFRERADERADIYRFFGVQCSLVLKFSWQIAELQKMRRLEDQLHRAQKMEAVGQLAGGIAHDFNNTLSGITGYAQLIKRRFGTAEPEAASYADAIIGAARRSADLTEKLLAFARKGKVQAVPLDLHAVVDETLQILEPTIGGNIRIVTKLAAQPAIVLGDPTQLQNILINLAINARNAMPTGGELQIATATQTVTRPEPIDNEYEIRPGDYVVLSVKDTGTGMDDETKRRAFEPFFTTDPSGKGSGLGLSSVYGMVKSHRGFITVASAKGMGSTFRVFLPLLHAERDSALKPERHKTEQIVRGHGHVLVVDDDQLICSLSKETLQFLGYSVTALRSGAEAVAYFREHAEEVDVAIIDIMMPEMDGYETFHEIRHIRPDAKVILTTGYSLPKDTRNMAALGLAGFIQKPFDSGKLSQMLYDTIHSEQSAGADAGRS